MAHDVVTQLITHFQQRINLYAAVILAFSYHFLFEKDLPCTCNRYPRDCYVYMGLPLGIIFVAQLWMDKALQRSYRGREKGCCERGCFCLVCSHLLSVFFVSSIWPISVLIDGDWTACCLPRSHNISCKNVSKRTDEEHAIISGIKDDSRMWGLSFLLGLFCVAFFISCCYNNSKCLREVDLLEIVLEEEQKVLSDEMRKKANEQLKEKVKADMKAWCYPIGPTEPPSETASVPLSVTASETSARPLA